MRTFKFIFILLICLSISVDSQAFLFFKKKNKKIPVKTEQVTKPTKNGTKAYKDVITAKAKSTYGFFTVHKVDDKYYFEIPDSMLGRDLLVVNRIAKAAADSRKGFLGYAGDKIGESVIRFDKGDKNKIFLKSVSFSERSKDSTGMLFSVRNSNLQPILAAFDIKAIHKDTVHHTKSLVIDVTSFVNSDTPVLYFDERVKKYLSLGSVFKDRSYLDTIKAFPMNIEIRAVKTYAHKASSPKDVSGNPFTYELNSSIVLLPKVPMKPRYFDPRVGYFTTSYVDFDKDPQRVENVSMITRWRLQPKPEDVAKYERGELVEPEKPIVFYIDPATPKKWVPYLIQGVDDWQKAFEKAGFKNAIYAKVAPKDSTWSIDDARHSAIVYKPSAIPNASGPNIHDPRSGEILECHINWYHNVMKLVHDWYFVQTAAVDTNARKMEFSDSLMGQLIRFVSSHEVGHTLGLRHNFGSSSTVPVEKLRDRKWLDANGHTPSIMDYARFDYVAQPEDSIPERDLFPRIGIYDKWAIQWGYTYLPQFKTAQDEVPYLNKWVIAQLKKDKRYYFGTETDPNDPRNQSEDLGDNAMLASDYGIMNLKRILPNMIKWLKEPNKDYSNVGDMYNQIVLQYFRYMGHVTKNIAGIYTTPKRVEQPGAVYEYVPYKKQKDAMQFLNKQLFKTPEWLINTDLIQKCNVDPVESIGKVQKAVLNRLISMKTIDKLLQDETLNTEKPYTATEMLSDLKKDVWSDALAGKSIDIYRRNLQKNYVNAMITLMNAGNSTKGDVSDATALARADLSSLESQIKKAVLRSNGITKAHLQEMAEKIHEALYPTK